MGVVQWVHHKAGSKVRPGGRFLGLCSQNLWRDRDGMRRPDGTTRAKPF